MPIQPCSPIVRLNAGSAPVQLSARSNGVRYFSASARNALSSARNALSCGVSSGGGANRNSIRQAPFCSQTSAAFSAPEGNGAFGFFIHARMSSIGTSRCRSRNIR